MSPTDWPLRAVLGLSLCLAAPALAAEPARAADPLDGLAFLVGEWTATGGGRPGEATAASFAFSRELGGRVLVRRNRAEYAPRPGAREAVVHEDLMIVYAAPPGLRAIYFDNEGHVIHYAVAIAGGVVTFESEAGSGPRFKLAYERTGEREVSATFSIAPPGKPYQTYVSGTARRK